MTRGEIVLGPSFTLALVLLLVLAYCLVDIGSPPRVAVLAAVALACVICTRTPTRAVGLRLLPILSFAAVSLVLVVLAPVRPDDATVTLPGWHEPVSAQAARFLSAVAIKSALVVVTVTAFACVIGEREVLAGLKGLRLPHRVVDLAYFTLRSVNNVRDEVVRLVRARDSRGKARGIRKVRTVAAMSRVLLIRLAQRAETQAFALWARHYDGQLPVLGQPRVTGLEIAVLAVVAAGLALVTFGL